MTRLYDKYQVTKHEGETDSDAVYFVLRVDTDKHARKALIAYALSVRAENIHLAFDARALALEHADIDEAIELARAYAGKAGWA